MQAAHYLRKEKNCSDQGKHPPKEISGHIFLFNFLLDGPLSFPVPDYPEATSERPDGQHQVGQHTKSLRGCLVRENILKQTCSYDMFGLLHAVPWT